MTSHWPTVALNELLYRSDEVVALQPDVEYRELTVKLWGRGVVLRGVVTGAQVAAQRRFRVRAGQFILSRIDARNGALGMIPDDLDGAIVSNDFPAFAVRSDRLLPHFIELLSRTASFVEMCRKASEGTTNRVRLQEDRFLRLTIPLPSLPEQQRIVARIDELAKHIEEARGIRSAVTGELEGLWPSLLHDYLTGRATGPQTDMSRSAEALLGASARRHSSFDAPNHNNAHPHRPVVSAHGPHALPKGWAWTTLGSVLTHLVDCVNDTPDFADSDTGLIGLKSTNIRPYRMDLTFRWFMKPDDFRLWNRRTRPQTGDIVLTREAPMGYACQVPDDLEVCLTQRLMLLRADADAIDPTLLLHYLNSRCFREQVEDKCRGLTTPHIRVQDAPHFALPLPPLQEQKRIVAELDALRIEVDTLNRLQVESAAELDALLPAILDRAFKGEL